MKLSTQLAIGAAAGVVLLGVLKYAKDQLPNAAAAVGNAVNPLSQDNIFYGGVSGVTEKVTGEPTFGSWLASIFDPTTRAANEAMQGLNDPSSSAANTGGATGYW